jgi:ribosome-associated translation inhibitor RaiA
MRTTITARRCDIPDELRARARERLDRLGKVASRPQQGQVTFAEEHGEAAVEVRLHAARGRVYVGRAVAVDHRSALDRAAARVRRQLDKRAPVARRRPRVRESR